METHAWAHSDVARPALQQRAGQGQILDWFLAGSAYSELSAYSNCRLIRTNDLRARRRAQQVARHLPAIAALAPAIAKLRPRPQNAPAPGDGSGAWKPQALELGHPFRRPGGMRACPTGLPVKAHAPVLAFRFPTSGFGRRSERYIGRQGKPNRYADVDRTHLRAPQTRRLCQ
jgi:hypothetical protein